MDREEFRKRGHEIIDWIAEYYGSIEHFPVRSRVKPDEILRQLPEAPPDHGERFEDIFADFEKILMPGITHWQHPSFFAYFPANGSYPSILAEMVTAALGLQCMSWQTSPAATELEERVMQWLRIALDLPETFTGVIQDTASTSTLAALLTARERLSECAINRQGFSVERHFTVYCSREAHSSIEKAVKIAGFGSDHLRTIGVDPETFAMRNDLLERQIESDLGEGLVPCMVVAALGTTGSTAIDPLTEIGRICRKHGIWLHVDAAYAGTTLLVPEMRWISEGVALADSFVFNPHKWMFTNFDCSAYFVRDPDALVRTFAILPEYLKTREGNAVNNYRDWGIPLGRRFRALKLWFVLRCFGLEGLRALIRDHLRFAKEFASAIAATPDFELLAPVPFAVVCFHYKPDFSADKNVINDLNARLLETLNDTGKIYLTHTVLGGNYTLRLSIGQTATTKRHVDEAFELIVRCAREMKRG